MMLTVAEIAAHLRAHVIGDPSLQITGLSSADKAQPGDLIFAENEKYLNLAQQSQASAILVPNSVTAGEKTLIPVSNVRLAIATLLPLFHPPEKFTPGIHPSASIHPDSKIEPTAHIGPNCILAPGVRIGAHSVLIGGNNIGAGVQIGENVTLYPNVVIYPRTLIGNRVAIHAGTVIGSDGYGYVFDQGRHHKVLQVGNVIIEDDVEIGANAAIDRGALDSTIIRQGTKIDNLVHVAHNVVIGKHCLVMGQVGFAGSTQLGDYCVIASQSGIAGHLKLGTQSTVGAKSGVMRDIPDGATVLGIPAQPDKQMKRQWISLQQLPEMLRRLRDLEKELQTLKNAAPQSATSQPPSTPQLHSA